MVHPATVKGTPKYDVMKGKATEIEVAPIPESIKAILVVRKIRILNLHRHLRSQKANRLPWLKGHFRRLIRQ